MDAEKKRSTCIHLSENETQRLEGFSGSYVRKVALERQTENECQSRITALE